MNKSFRRYLIKFFNNPIGRRYLGSPRDKKIYKITPTGVHYYTGDLAKNGLPLICTGDRSAGQKDIVRQKIFKLAGVLSTFAFLPIFPKSLLPLVALMADTGWHSPTVCSGGTNCSNAYASNDTYATVILSKNGGNLYIKYSSFGFGIGASDTIQGIEISAEHYVDVVNSDGSSKLYWLGDSITSDLYTLAPSEIETTETLGGSTDLWGETPNGSDFSDENFEARFYVSNGAVHNVGKTFYLDHIKVKVYYTETPSYTGPFPTFRR